MTEIEVRAPYEGQLIRTIEASGAEAVEAVLATAYGLFRDRDAWLPSAARAMVLRETARVLKPGGRFAVSDVIADPGVDDATRSDLAQYVGCVAGALTADEYTRHLTDAGLAEIEITETHRVHEHAGSAIIRARKPV